MGGGLLGPKNPNLGADIAGRVEAVGSNVREFRPGDEVFGDIAACGNGGFAEYVAVPESALAPEPANLSFEQAAAVPMAAITALQALRDFARIRDEQQVLIYGASRGVGTFAVQIARAFGAEVTAVCSSRQVGVAHSIGADQVIDYTQEDFDHRGNQYDLILAANGYRSIFDYRRALRPQGVCAVTGGSMAQLFQVMLLGPRLTRAGGQKFGSMPAHPNKQDYDVLNELLAAGKVVPVIDRGFPLAEAAEALRYVGAGHARGKVVITMEKGQ